ncbi:MAG: hypothetical protein R3C61_05090 [Bacteroidia bacterium]
MRLFFFIFLSAALALPGVYGQVSDSLRSSTELFSSEEPLKIRLSFDQRKFSNERFKDEYHPAAITLFAPNGDSVSGNIRIKARGEFRRRYCQLPPFRLNFKESGFSDPSFEGVSSLKVVTICKYQPMFQEYIFREYTLYQLYQLFSPLSFRVRMVDMTFSDSEKKRKPIERYGFLIEDIDDVGKRNHAFELEPERVNSTMINRKHLILVAVFQFMIGNSDWYVVNLHNLKLLKSQDFKQETPYPVPYDFDYAGMVDAMYAVPPDGLGIETVKDRIYRGPCFTQSEQEEVFDLFRSKKEEAIKLFQESPWISEHSRKTSISYIEDFYEIIENPVQVKTQILNTCKR